MRGRDADYDLFRTVGREFTLVCATLRLILGGVLDRHPDLVLIVEIRGPDPIRGPVAEIRRRGIAGNGTQLIDGAGTGARTGSPGGS